MYTHLWSFNASYLKPFIEVGRWKQYLSKNHLKKETKDSGVQYTSLPWTQLHFFLLYSQEFQKKFNSSYTQFPPSGWTSGPSDGPHHHSQCFCTSVSQAQRQWWVYRKKHMTQKQVTQVPMPPNKENHHFYIFLIWSTHHLGNSTQSLWIHMKKYLKILRWNIQLERKWWFFTIQKNSCLWRMTAYTWRGSSTSPVLCWDRV